MVLGAAALLFAGAAPSGADTFEGRSWILSVDAQRSRVTLEDGVYAVAPGTRIVDADGRPLSLSELPEAPDLRGLRPLVPELGVRYEAETRDGVPVLRVLELGVQVPE